MDFHCQSEPFIFRLPFSYIFDKVILCEHMLLHTNKSYCIYMLEENPRSRKGLKEMTNHSTRVLYMAITFCLLTFVYVCVRANFYTFVYCDLSTHNSKNKQLRFNDIFTSLFLKDPIIIHRDYTWIIKLIDFATLLPTIDDRFLIGHKLQVCSSLAPCLIPLLSKIR